MTESQIVLLMLTAVLCGGLGLVNAYNTEKGEQKE